MSDVASNLAKLVVERMKEITHLNTVLRRRNRKVKAQHEALEDLERRNFGLLAAFESVRSVPTIEAAHEIAQRVLKYDERKGRR